MSEYRLTVNTARPLGTMKVLMDAVADELERRGLTEDEYDVQVEGPAELHIGLVMR